MLSPFSALWICHASHDFFGLVLAEIDVGGECLAYQNAILVFVNFRPWIFTTCDKFTYKYCYNL